MARAVLIHGIGQQGSTRTEQERLWLPSLVKGVLRSGHLRAGALAAEVAASLEPGSEPIASMAFYGNHRDTPERGNRFDHSHGCGVGH